MKPQPQPWSPVRKCCIFLDVFINSRDSLFFRIKYASSGWAKVAQHIVSFFRLQNILHLKIAYNLSFFHADNSETFRSLWMIGVWQWCSLATASQVSQKMLRISDSVNPLDKRSFISWRTCICKRYTILLNYLCSSLYVFTLW